jgi:hypothetical protein
MPGYRHPIGVQSSGDPIEEIRPILSAINHPALIVNGSNDTMLPADNSYFMFKHLRKGQQILILTLDAVRCFSIQNFSSRTPYFSCAHPCQVNRTSAADLGDSS